MALGYVEPIWSAFERGGLGSYELQPLPQGERLLAHMPSDPFDGAFEFVNPDPISQNYGGHRTFSFLDDFYFRVYLLPNSLDFGAIVTTTTREITVWNAYFDSVTLESIEFAIGEEVALGGDAVPHVMPALTLKAWPFTVTSDGPPNLEETITFTFSTTEVFDVEVTGQRSLLWPFLPNWREPYRITREFKTDVFTGRSGREQRSAVRDTSRKSIEFLITTQGADLRRYRQIMALWQHRPFIVPDASRSTHTTSEMDAGEFTVNVETMPLWMQEDSAVVLAAGEQTSLRVIESIDSNGLLTFKDTDTFNWPEDTRIYAGVVAKLQEDPRGRRFNNGVQETNLRFLQLPGTEVEVFNDAILTFNGKELFLGQPNWGGTVGADDMHTTDTLDYGHGRILTTSPVAYSQQMWTGDFLGKSAEEIESLLHMFERMKGRRGEFYMPTWENDVPLKGDILSSTLGFRTEGTAIFDAFAADDTHKAMMIQLVDGTRIFKVIDEIITIDDTDGLDTLINFTEVWDQGYDNDEVEFACWLQCWRFATDALTAEFVTDEAANMRMNFQSLEDLPAEDEESNS